MIGSIPAGMTKIANYLESRGQAFHAALSIALIALIAWVDFIMPDDFSFGIFYLIPLSLTSWFLRGRAKSLITVLTLLIWLSAEIRSVASSSRPALQYWNVAAGFVFMFVVASLVTALRRAYQHQRSLARTDYLTQVANSRAFHELAESERSRSVRYERPYAIACLDVDNFKFINDTLGHGTGDSVLRSVCRVITANLRTTDSVGRLGGDEFAILLPETANDDALNVVAKVRIALLREMEANGWPVTFSFGVVTCYDPTVEFGHALELADSLVYDAKNSGKNTIKYDEIVAPQLMSISAAG